MPIKMSLKKNNFQMMWEFKGFEVLSTSGNIAIAGNVMNSYMTAGNVNSLFKKLYSIGKKAHWFLDQETIDVMEQDERTKYLLSKGNINIVPDWKQFKFGADMKFTGIVLNPPYGNLHLPILKDSLEHADWEHDAQVVCIHPAAWLQFPSRIRPSFMDGLIESFDMIDRKEANEMFGIEGGDLVVTTLSKDGDSFTGNAAEDKKFCCFKYNSQFTNTWKIVKSIYEKVITKYSQGNFDLQLNKNATSNYLLRICITHNTVKYPIGTGKTGGVIKLEDAFKITSKHYTTATKTTVAAGVKFLNFNTENERKNAWASYLTKFARFCIAMDESTKLAPYMDDYTDPWTDKRFKEYFGLTDIEWQLIDTVIKD